MKYPMKSTVDMTREYPYRFRFDLINGGPKPMHQIPALRNMVNTWLAETGIVFQYQHGLQWCLKNEQDAMLFKLRFL